ncbi:MAG: hypothetical protein Q9200_004098 [Gallowayella weberi]
MYTKLFSIAVLAATAFAQNATNSSMSSKSLNELLGSTDSLSTLATAVQGVPGLAQMLGSASNVTILAPSNEAFEKFMRTPGAAALASNDTSAIQALLSYHILNGTFPSSVVTEMPTFLPTMLNNSAYSNVTGGQVVEVLKQGDKVLFYSGLLSNASVTTADQNFTGGVVHIIDNVLTIPQKISSTAEAAGLTGVAGALTQAKLVDTVDSLKDVTVFAPNNSAFQAIGSALPNLNATQLAGILQYHVVNGTVACSSTLENDVLVANGVVHVIDNVLNPNKTDAAPQPTAEVQAPAFEGATSVTSLGLTSGVPTPTNAAGFGTAPTMAQGGGSSSSAGGAMQTGAPAGAAPRVEGMMGVAALFAGAGIWLNA